MSLMDKLSKKDEDTLEELKRRTVKDVPNHLKDDMFLYLRFLRARNFDIDAAEDMLRNHLVWRKVNGIDNLMKTFKLSGVVVKVGEEGPTLSPLEKKHERMKFALKYLPFKKIGFDKEGCPVIYFGFGDMDSKGILKCTRRIIAINAIVSTLEENITDMKKQSEILGKPIEQWTYIVNFENFSLMNATHKPTIEGLIALFTAYEANYPERLKIAYAINASVYFHLLFSIIKPFLSGTTLNKIRIFGKDGWKEELLSAVHEEDLPPFLGGTKTDPDGKPYGTTLAWQVLPVPETYYISNSKKRRLSRQFEYKKLIIPRMSKAFINMDVEEPGSLIEWEYETDEKDIGFKLMYKNSNYDDVTIEMVPYQRIEVHPISEVGTYYCEFPGTYIMVFDNSYSWMHQKHIYYRASVVSPKGQNAAY